MAKDSNRRLVVVRPKRTRPPHHAGAWKVAYADFVTAMMAFFLLLWLLNVTTDTQKLGIAHYFAPENVSTSTSGTGGVLAGTSILSKGAMPHDAGGFVLGMPEMSGGEANEDLPDKTFPPKPAPHPVVDATQPATLSGKPENGAGPVQGGSVSDAILRAALAARDERDFARAEAALRQAIESVPQLRRLRDNLIVDRTPEGLRIQIVDQQHEEMFARGSPLPNPHLRELVALVARAIEKLPNRLVLAGHTDSIPYPPGAHYTNWELSMDRANACRRALIEAGVSPGRIVDVLGKADTDPLIARDRADPRNRRISFVLLRQTGPAPPVVAQNQTAAPSRL